MAEEIFNICRYGSGSYMGMSLRITDPNPRHQPLNQIDQTSSPTLVEQICLKFKVQLKCQHFQVWEGGNGHSTTLVREHIRSQHSFATFQLPISIFKHGDKTLKRILFREFKMYGDIINIELLANEIIKHWVRKVEEEEDQENNSNVLFKKIYPLEIMIRLLVSKMIRAVQPQLAMIDQPLMVPTSDSAVESMLKRVKNEEIMKSGDDESINCVVCLEEISKEEKGSETTVLQMPCLHMFHEECIRKWLKTSHYCPTCRFSMPIDN